MNSKPDYTADVEEEEAMEVCAEEHTDDDDEPEQSRWQKQHDSIISTLYKTKVALTNSRAPRVQNRLYEYQVDCLIALENFFNRHQNHKALVVAPAGSGKSGLIALLPFVLKSRKCIVFTPAPVITNQIRDAFGYPEKKTSFLVKTGIVAPEKHRNKLDTFFENPFVPVDASNTSAIASHALVIVNVQKFGGNALFSLTTESEKSTQLRKAFSKFDTAIVDEAHHFPAATWVNIIKCFEAKKVILLTATPYRGHIGNEISLTDIPGLELAYKIPKEILEGKLIYIINYI